jgi:signal transduction histidine kinase
MVTRIKKTERLKLERWSNTIVQKAELVNYVQVLYNELEEEENKKMEIFADAYQRFVGDNQYEDLTFVSKIIRMNTSIPMIIVYSDTSLNATRNLNLGYEPESNNPEHKTAIKKLIEEEFTRYKPFPIYLDMPGRVNENTEKLLMFYNDSHIYSDLKNNLNSLIASFEKDIRENDLLAPVIYTNNNLNRLITFGNIDSIDIDTPEKLRARCRAMASENEPISVDLGDGNVNLIFYENSFIINQLKYYPIVQLSIIGIYILITYMLFSSFRRSEQNQVWAGMSKETAHQLGTPISSLMAWVELLKEQGVSPEVITEINKDIDRLVTITDRFSKIGSQPELKPVSVNDILEETKQYLETRLSKRVQFTLEINLKETPTLVRVNKPLFSWVIENMVKNAIDAMRGEGELDIEISESETKVFIDISDNGKGILPSQQKLVFEPGFTSKKRGWGLGLSLAKRIVNDYHNGKVFIKFSEPGIGTTFRIVLNKSL